MLGDATMLGPALRFKDLPNWSEGDHAGALKAFGRSARRALEFTPKTRSLGPGGSYLREISDWYYHLDEGILGAEAQQFFEDHFIPRKIIPDLQNPQQRGFVTGYYEPEVEGSLTKTDIFTTPLLRRPPDLIELKDLPDNIKVPEDWDPSIRFAKLSEKEIIPYFDREQIEQGELDGRNLELVYLKDPIDAFFIHIQGSARIRLDDGNVMRVSFDGKTGHPYTPIGRVLIERGHVAREDMSMQAIRTWMTDHRDQQYELMWHNKSYIFFKEQMLLDPTDGPIGASSVPLLAGHSLAVDRTLHTFGTPIFLNVDHTPVINRLMIAQDTGSAIVGPARGDIFFGSGKQAEEEAGIMQNAADFFMLWPKRQPI